MDQTRSDKPEGAPAYAQNANAGAPSGAAGPERRFSAQRKLAAVSRLLRGEPLETVARELNVTVARLSEWRDRALVGAEAAMKERERDGRDEELLRLRAKLGEITMANELLERKIAALEGGRPLARRSPVGACSDAELLEHIRAEILGSRLHGEGYRKIWARLRHAGIRTSARRVRRLMGQHGLRAPHRVGRPEPRAHDGVNKNG